MKLYHHKTSGGAEYLTDTFIRWEHDGKKGKEGTFKGAKYIVRIDGDITKDAELNGRACNAHDDLLAACVLALDCATNPGGDLQARAKQVRETLSAAIAKATT